MATSLGNPYEILGVARDADDQEIKQAFRQHSKDAHPDRGGMAEQFNQLNSAYRLLTDERRRRKYDAIGETEDETIDAVQAAATELIAGILQAIVCDEQVAVDLCTVDLVAGIDRGLDKQIGEIELKRASVSSRLTRYSKLKKRFRAKRGKPNIIKRLIEAHERDAQVVIDKMSRDIEIRRRAQEIVRDHSFDVEQQLDHACADPARVDPWLRAVHA